MKRWMMLAAAGSLAAIAAAAEPSPRQRLTMDFGWKFMLGDPAGAEASAFGDSSWQAVDLPHDWSIHLAFDPAAPSGRAGGFLPTGIGWYRKTFRVPEADAGRLVEIEFDGIRERGEVWINGHVLGQRPYGYTSVLYDMSPYLNFGENDNVLAVRVDKFPPAKFALVRRIGHLSPRLAPGDRPPAHPTLGHAGDDPGSDR